MAKKAYVSPVLLSGLTPGDDPSIVIGGSQGTSGYDSMWTFEGIDEDIIALIDLNCDDFDLQDMDTDGNYIITLDEFNAWFEANQPW